MPPTLNETLMAFLGIAIVWLLTPFIIFFSMPIIAFFLNGLYAIGLIGHG